MGSAWLAGCASQLVPTPQDQDLLAPPAPYRPPVSTSTPRIVSPTPDVTSTPPATPSPVWTWSPGMQYSGMNLCFVLWDHQLARYNYKPRNIYNPVPETCPLYSGAINPLTPRWIAYWQGILHLCNPTVTGGDFEHSWNSLVRTNRAFTNDTGPETGTFAIHSLTCGGATHALTTSMAEGGYLRINTLNWGKGPPPIPSSPDGIDMTRHFFATACSNRQLPDGSYVVNGFPQFENCIVPLISQGDTDLIDISRIKMVNSIQRPYNP